MFSVERNIFSAQQKDKFLVDLRKSQEIRDPKELNIFLNNMRARLDNPDILTGETLNRLLLSFRFVYFWRLNKSNFRDNQNYDAMISLIDDINRVRSSGAGPNVADTVHCRYLYAFALTR